MNPGLERLQRYPFERLRELLRNVKPATLSPVDFSLGEPQHVAPPFLEKVMRDNLSALSRYPTTAGTPALRDAIADWLQKRFDLHRRPDPEREILPVNGTREGLFSIAQCMIPSGRGARVAMPNPFYQIYEGAAHLAGGVPCYLPLEAANGYLPDLDRVPPATWRNVRLLYLCSPANPTGSVMGSEALAKAAHLAATHDFILASDECYSEIYYDEQQPPPGLLQACDRAGIRDYKNCLVFHSLSKRSSLPGLRSGFVAGDAKLIEAFRLYRTYHGCAMSEQVQAVSAAAWRDELHVRQNRSLYRHKFDRAREILAPLGPLTIPPAGFYLWLPTPADDLAFSQRLFAEQNVRVLPGSFLGREVDGHNPGSGYVRIALVAESEPCAEGITRIRDCLTPA